MAPVTLPVTTTSLISIHLPNTFERLFSRAVVSKGKCEPPKCTPATPKQTMIIAICFAVGLTLIFALAMWWYCWRPRKKEAEFHELLMKVDGPEPESVSNDPNGTVTTDSTNESKNQSGASSTTVGGSRGGSGGLSSLT